LASGFAFCLALDFGLGLGFGLTLGFGLAFGFGSRLVFPGLKLEASGLIARPEVVGLIARPDMALSFEQDANGEFGV
jgi:hypothetical protein